MRKRDQSVVLRLGKPSLGVVLVGILVAFGACSDSSAPSSPSDPCRENLVPIEDLDTEPERISGLMPAYPYQARRDGWEGSVVVSIVVNADGTVCDTGIAESSGREDVDTAVLNVTESWIYEPGTIGGEPVRTEIEQNMSFEIAK